MNTFHYFGFFDVLWTQRRSCASQTLANFWRENQISSIIRRTKGKRTILFHQFYSAKKCPKGYAHDSKTIPPPQLETAKSPYSQSKTFQKIKKWGKIFEIFRDFTTCILVQNIKKMILFGVFTKISRENKKWEFWTVSIAEKSEGMDPLGFFKHSFCCKISKKWREDPLGKFFRKKVSQCRKKTERGELLVSSGIVCYAGNLFGSVPSADRGNLKFCRTFGRTILVTSGVSKKKHDLSQPLYKRRW